MLSENFQGLILQFGNTKSAAPCIVLAIDIFHSARKGFCKLLHRRGVDAFIIGQSFFNMVDERLSANFTQAEGNDFSVPRESARNK